MTAPIDTSVRAEGQLPKAPTSNRAASMLEGLFLRQLFKVMRSTVPKSGLMGGGFDSKTYTEMLDGAMADEVSRGGGLGLQRALVGQLGGDDASTAPITLSLPGPLPIGGSRSSGRVGAGVPATTFAPQAMQLPRAEAERRLARVAEADGISFEPPRRPGTVQLQDGDGRLAWPAPETRRALDDQGRVIGLPSASVIAAASGTVVAASQSRLIIDHGKGRRTTYEGLGRVLAQRGDLVLRGQAVAESAASGRFGFGLHQGGAPVGLQPSSAIFDQNSRAESP